jgi:hypothetical protein
MSELTMAGTLEVPFSFFERSHTSVWNINE